MNTNKLYHYTYIITNVVENKYYIGCRSSDVHPSSDLGIKYLSSSKDKNFIHDQKINRQNYKYKVIAIFKNRESALSLEVKLHCIHGVSTNNKFYNKAKQTSSKFYYSAKGIPLSLTTRKKLSDSKVGDKNYNARPANIYEFGTDKLIAENVIIHTWAKSNGYNQGHLASTVRADRDKPHHWRDNMHYHKGVYARYV